ncbi:SDR family oxidoreductase [Streptomyces yunnanensis]|uniref:NAD(P)-dependent dehydrogenase, short-chain alcohol dehydrogenase family n=1 Tax=Streptomyces yunnanensis TaxID=156453 RepID=A0A9X8N285_9ACTN|nr:SDR family oxidoreductase [Streptomyces yunnanensis]SHM71243.1 NAD(P)-dependent dehydrogenase, short-chain alcohol dehydrogenase family [Streptomyces yunnanensis]
MTHHRHHRPLEGKIALVTGGSRGIGRAIAERLGRDGAVVAVAYARDAAAADDVVARIRKDGGRAVALHAPLGHHGDAADLWSAFDERITEHAPGMEARPAVDIIVNNAGIAMLAALPALTEEDFDTVFAVNVRAPFFVVREGLKRLRDGGRIINISSGAGRLAMPEAIAYGATKGALDNFTLNLAKELGPRGITANAVAPGIVDTDVNAEWLRGNPAAEADAASRAALGRVGQPDDVADIVAFLASHDARWVTGKVIDATGGARL